MFSPTGLYVCGVLFLALLVLARFLSRGNAAALFLVAAAVTAFESGLLTDFGLPLPAGLLLVLAGLKTQMLASGLILALNLALGWVLLRLLAGHEDRPHYA